MVFGWHFSYKDCIMGLNINHVFKMIDLKEDLLDTFAVLKGKLKDFGPYTWFLLFLSLLMFPLSYFLLAFGLVKLVISGFVTVYMMINIWHKQG